MPTLLTPRQKRAALAKRRKWIIGLAILGSLLLHVVALFLFAWLAPRWPRRHLQGKPLGPLKVIFQPSASPTPTPTPGVPGGTPIPYIRTDDDQETKEKVVDPNFITDKDTLAAAERAAQGEKPLPTQEGLDVPHFDFADRPHRLGPQASQGASAPPAQTAPAQNPADAKPENQSPQATPKPENPRPPRKDPTAQATPAPNGELAAATPAPSATPEPPVPTPPKVAQEEGNTPPQPTRRQPANNVRNPSLAASNGPPKPPGYQPETRQNKVEGNINNRGKPAVQALGTPLGRYIKSMQDSIGALWYYRVDEKMDVLSTGQVKIHFWVTQSGKAVRLSVVRGEQNSALASVSTGAVMDADIPPIPADVAATLPNRELEVDLGFDMY